MTCLAVAPGLLHTASTFFTAHRNNGENHVDSARDSRAAFMTARSRGHESGFELDTAREMETARDRQMETARDTDGGFDTDYMSAYEPGTSRTWDTFGVRSSTVATRKRAV